MSYSPFCGSLPSFFRPPFCLREKINVFLAGGIVFLRPFFHPLFTPLPFSLPHSYLIICSLSFVLCGVIIRSKIDVRAESGLRLFLRSLDPFPQTFFFEGPASMRDSLAFICGCFFPSSFSPFALSFPISSGSLSSPSPVPRATLFDLGPDPPLSAFSRFPSPCDQRLTFLN